MGLVGGQPVSQSYPQILNALDAANPGGKIGAKQTAVGGLVCQSSHRPETKIDGAGCQLPHFQVASIAHYHSPVERQARLGAVPINEFVDDVPISPLRIKVRQAVQHCGLCVFQIRQTKNCSGSLSLRAVMQFTLHGRWPPSVHRTMIHPSFGSARSSLLTARNSEAALGERMEKEEWATILPLV